MVPPGTGYLYLSFQPLPLQAPYRYFMAAQSPVTSLFLPCYYGDTLYQGYTFFLPTPY
jgi:hypothetical protein